MMTSTLPGGRSFRISTQSAAKNRLTFFVPWTMAKGAGRAVLVTAGVSAGDRVQFSEPVCQEALEIETAGGEAVRSGLTV